MTFFKLALALLGIARSILAMIEKRNAEDAAEARLYLKAMEDVDDRLAKAKSAAAAARADAAAGRLPEDIYRD